MSKPCKIGLPNSSSYARSVGFMSTAKSRSRARRSPTSCSHRPRQKSRWRWKSSTAARGGRYENSSARSASSWSGIIFGQPTGGTDYWSSRITKSAHGEILIPEPVSISSRLSGACVIWPQRSSVTRLGPLRLLSSDLTRLRRYSSGAVAKNRPPASNLWEATLIVTKMPTKKPRQRARYRGFRLLKCPLQGSNPAPDCAIRRLRASQRRSMISRATSVRSSSSWWLRPSRGRTVARGRARAYISTCEKGTDSSCRP